MKFNRKHAAVGAFAAGALSLTLPLAHSQPPQVAARAVPSDVDATTCAEGVVDAANPANCLEGSSVPSLGKLFTLSQDLFVQAGSGRVGIHTTFPFRTLEVDGTLGVSNGGRTHMVTRPSGSGQFGIVETVGGPFPGVTNLLSTSSIDDSAGALGTFRGNELLAALTTPAGDSRSGFVSVRNQNVEVAGINGNTGTVFGTVKAFVQPHPTDGTREIQYVSLEGPEHGVYMRGSARLADGVAKITLPESFRHVARSEGLTVNLTPLGPNRGLYVEHKGLEGIVVRENEGGQGQVAFDFLVMGERSALPRHEAVRANTHFAPRPGTSVAEGGLPGSYRALMIQNGTLDADGRVNELRATELGWRSIDGEWKQAAGASAEPARD